MNGSGPHMPVDTVVPEIVLIVGAVLVLLWALFAPQRWQDGAAWLSLLVLAGATVTTAVSLRGGQALTFFQTYSVDDVAVWGRLLVLAVTALTVLLSLPWLRPDPRRGEYYTLLLISCLGAVILAAATDLMAILLGALMASVTGYVMAAYHRASARSGEAGIKYYLLGGLTNAAMLYGVVLLFGLGGTTTLPGLREGLADAPALPLVVAVGLVVVGLAFKLGAAPSHAWVPDVADGAPAPVAAFLTAAPKVGALIALARLVQVLPEQAAGWRLLVAVVAAATMTVGNLAALAQDDVRRLLGWSSVSQIGYGLMAVVALGRSQLAVPSLLFFLVAYSLANVSAFAVVVQLRGIADRNHYRGLARSRPVLGACLLLSMLSFVGLPPLAGFTAKLMLFGATIDAGYTWLAVVAVVNTVVSLAYYLRVLVPVYLLPSERRFPVLAPSAGAVAAGTAALVLIWGVAAEPLLAAFGRAELLP